MRRHVDQHGFDRLASDDGALDRRAERDRFVRMDGCLRLLAKMLGQHAADQRNPRRAADQEHLVQVARPQAGIAQRSVDRLEGRLHERSKHVLELVPRQLDIEVQLLHQVLARDELFGNVRKWLVGQRDLGRLGGAHQARERAAVLAQVDTVLPLEPLREVLDDQFIEVVAAQLGVAV